MKPRLWLGARWSDRRRVAVAVLVLLGAGLTAPLAPAVEAAPALPTVSAGWFHTCGLRANGTITCWGSNTYGQLTGVPTSGTYSAVSAGELHTCAIRTAGTLTCWGDNSAGQASAPAGTYVAVSSGGLHSCAIRADGSLTCWGDNSSGQAPASPAGTYTVVGSGYNHTCAIETDGTLACWGGDEGGESSPPAGTFVALSSGYHHSCAIRTDGSMACWGYNTYGEAPSSRSGSYAAVSMGYLHSCAIRTDGTLACWGLNDHGQAPASPSGTYTAVSAGAMHTCAVRTDGGFVCWGDDSYKQATPPGTYHAIAPARVLDTRPSDGRITNIGLSGPFVAGTVRTFQVTNAPYVGGGSAVAVPAGATAVTGNLTIVGETAAGVVALGPTMTPTGDVTTISFAVGDVRANNVTLGLAPDGTLQAVYRSSTVGATTHVVFDVTGYFLADASGATYHLLAPGRVLDTRPTGSGHTNIGLTGKFKNGVVRTFSVVGIKGLGWGGVARVPSGAVAVTGNLTVTNASTDGYVSVGPTMISLPKTSTINVKAGKNIANGVTVALKSGKLQAVWRGTSGASSADLIFDVTGYFTADGSGLSYYPVVPYRVLDTVTGTGLSGKFVSRTVRTLTVGGTGGSGGVPVDASGISGNLTLVNPAADGYAFAAPAITYPPASSTLNTYKAIPVANGLDVAITTSGTLALIWVGGTATADMQLDITGFWK